MNLQRPKFIMRNDSIGIETLPTLALFLHTSSLTFCNHLTHTMSAYSVLDVSIVSSVSGVSGVSRQREKPNQVRSMANLQFAVLCGSRVKGFGFRFLFRSSDCAIFPILFAQTTIFSEICKIFTHCILKLNNKKPQQIWKFQWLNWHLWSMALWMAMPR